MKNLLAFSTTVNVMFTIIALVVLIGLSILLFLKSKKEYLAIKNKVDNDKTLNEKDFEILVNKWISNLKKNGKCFIFQIDLRDYEKRVKAIGEEQYELIYKQIVDKLYQLQPYGVRVCSKDKNKLILVIRCGGDYDPKSLCELIVKNVAKAYKVGEMSVVIRINIAVACAPQDALTYAELKSLLKISMIMSRRKGFNSYEFYSATFANENSEKYIYYQEIKTAIDKKEFNLYYQPIIDSSNMEVYNAEALMRWVNKSRGVVAPSEFLNIMEETGDINWVGQWSFEQMVVQHTAWMKNYEQRFSLGFNLSDRQLNTPNTASNFIKTIKNLKANPFDYVFDVGESVLYATSKNITENLKTLSQAGFKICFEGFGKRITSPLSLEDINLDMIKIEKSYWKKASEDNLVRQMFQTLVEYARAKSIVLVGSGVESTVDLETLKNLNIRFMQGFLFDKPKDAKEFIGNVLLTPWEEEIKRNLSKGKLQN